LALGEELGRKVDYAIPQSFFDTLTAAQRDDTAGWFYDPSTARFSARHLTQTECWNLITIRLQQGELVATMMGNDVSCAVKQWPCLRFHVERREIQLERTVTAQESNS
jgi:hypothetical protein